MMKEFILGVLMFILVGLGDVQAAYDHQFSHWQEVLKGYTHQGRVNYKALIKNDSELKASIQAIESVSKPDLDVFDPKQKIAFWINAYNIETMKLVVDHYPLKRSLGLQALRYPANSIQQIPDVWNQEVLNILRNKVSLNYIENEILRKEFQDPRIHFAIVCASLGCAVLRDEPYVAERLDEQLTDQVKKFIQNPQKVRYDSRTNTLYVSPVFKWFKKDFEKAGGVVAFVKKYISSDIRLSDDAKIQWLDYDWSLNEQ